MAADGGGNKSVDKPERNTGEEAGIVRCKGGALGLRMPWCCLRRHLEPSAS